MRDLLAATSQTNTTTKEVVAVGDFTFVDNRGQLDGLFIESLLNSQVNAGVANAGVVNGLKKTDRPRMAFGGTVEKKGRIGLTSAVVSNVNLCGCLVSAAASLDAASSADGVAMEIGQEPRPDRQFLNDSAAAAEGVDANFLSAYTLNCVLGKISFSAKIPGPNHMPIIKRITIGAFLDAILYNASNFAVSFEIERDIRVATLSIGGKELPPSAPYHASTLYTGYGAVKGREIDDRLEEGDYTRDLCMSFSETSERGVRISYLSDSERLVPAIIQIKEA